MKGSGSYPEHKDVGLLFQGLSRSQLKLQQPDREGGQVFLQAGQLPKPPSLTVGLLQRRVDLTSTKER